MSDLISRKWLMECVDEGWIKFDTEKDTNTYIHLVRDIAPSAQPETHEKRTETHGVCLDDLIKRSDAVKIAFGYDKQIVEFIEGLPSPFREGGES